MADSRPVDRLFTDRLELRRMRRADAQALYAIMLDPETMRFWSTPPHADLATTAAFVSSTLERAASGEADDFVVTRLGQVIGKAGLWHGAALGILIARPHWGQGYGTEAVSAVIGRALSQQVARIEADVDPRNAGCIRLLERLGFRRTGAAQATFQVGEAWVDSLYFALTPAGATDG